MVSLLKKFIGDASERAVDKIRQQLAPQINALEAGLKQLSDAQLQAKTGELKAHLAQGARLDDLLVEAFAVVREAARRNIGQRHYDVQLVGGVVLHRGQIAEMRTGEGKTLVATLPAYLNALTGRGVHIVTVNDYLARRDPVWMGPIYHALGLTVGCLQHDSAYMYDPQTAEAESSKGAPQASFKHLRPVSRAEAYRADITYGTNHEFGFDYLRDNMCLELSQQVQRELHYAIVDEVDNILIDEARTPLIISGPAQDPVEHYYTFAKLAPRLQQERDYTIDDRTRAISLTEEGISKVEKWTIKGGSLYDPENYHLVHFVENALTAHVTKQRDKDYVVQNGEVIIVDEFTGRLQFGRRWSDGLHQAVEAKEGMKIQRESITYATITLQNYFRMYDKLAGMTGTALTESDEFLKIYDLEVAAIPTNLPMIRQDSTDLVFQTTEAKWRAVTEAIGSMHEKGRPVLVGTTSIEASEQLSDRLKRRGVAHQVLNAKNHEHEANIVAQAGRAGAVTVSTNMAGRGTDIILGGSNTSEPYWQEEHNKVVSLGGLHVIGTDHHDARRIDNQLRGRAGRQGDPGSSQFYIALEDDLMQRFGGDKIKAVMNWSGLGEDVPIENKLISRSISGAQVKVESYHFDIRKHLLDYDDVLNTQREVIYDDRHRILAGEGLRERIIQMLRQEFTDLVQKHLPGRHGDDWNPGGLLAELALICPVPPDVGDEEKIRALKLEEIEAKLAGYAETIYTEREQAIGPENMRVLERLLLLRAIDTHWVQHLTAMENLRTGIGLHAYGQRDPLVMYRAEGHKMFQELTQRMQSDVVHTIFRVNLVQQPVNQPVQTTSQTEAAPPRRAAPQVKASPMQAVMGKGRPAVAVGAAKVGRNAPCPCGSGKKYKRCCGVNA
ncbi:MAG: preprotein translocase subunit SecA [SAR202 cluster bacterium]|nr:preprotein translocase subunit SecA [SAR202 cluster bacterium]